MSSPGAATGKKKQVRIAPNGPYLVRGGIPLQSAGGEPIATGDSYALCRCGQSSEKPFCDGTHAKAGFSGEETADRRPVPDRCAAYRGKGITVFDDRSVCSHAGICTDNLANVFVHGGTPWIVPEAEEDVQKIIDIVRRCPSGALSYSLGESAETVEEEREPAITVSKDGPLGVVGRPELQGSDGFSYERRARYTLCRWGGSKNKPYCDGTHWHIGFQDG